MATQEFRLHCRTRGTVAWSNRDIIPVPAAAQRAA